MNNGEKMAQANTESDNTGFDSLAQEPPFDEHMKEIKWADVRKLGYEEQKNT